MIDKIKHWRRVMGLPVAEKHAPKLPKHSDIKLAMELIKEEINELKEAVSEDDLEEIQDALGDIVFVLQQLADVYNISLEKCVNEVYTSNMSKFCKTKKEALETVKAYVAGTHPSKPGEKILAYSRQVGDVYVVHRASDKKVLKALSYKEPVFT